MKTIRRLYFYLVTFISLEVVLWGIIRLARSFVSGENTGQVRLLAGALSLIIVGIPVFLLHGWLAQRSALSDLEERSSRVRAVFFYGGLLATLIPVVQNILALAARGFAALLDLDPAGVIVGGDQTLADNLIAAVGNLLAAALLYWLLRQDWQSDLQGDDFTETRRLYRYIWLLYGLGILGFGIQQVVSYSLNTWGSSARGVRYLFSDGLALLLVGIPLWLYTANRLQRSLAEPAESQSLLRLVVLYILVIAAIGAVLASAGMLLEQIFMALFGVASVRADFLGSISDPASILAPWAVIWVIYGRTLAAEIKGASRPAAAVPAGESPGEEGRDTAGLRRARLRRIYFYMIALFGLIGLLQGLQILLSVGIQMAFDPAASWERALQRQLATGLAAFIVGLPTWLVAWRPMRREALGENEAGDHARRSVVRKSYLYLVLFAGLIGVMVSAGTLLFQWFRVLLGDRVGNLELETLQTLRLLLLFGLLLFYHWQALRGDSRLAQRSLARRHAQFPVLVLVPDNGSFGDELVGMLEREVPGLPVAQHPFSQGAPDETLSAARVVILPAALLARPSEAMRLWLQGFSGKKLVIPLSNGSWYWVESSRQNLRSLARQAAHTVRSWAEGEEPSPARFNSPWLIVIYLLGGIVVVQILIGLISLIISSLGS